MHHTVIRYQTKPEATEQNATLIEDVFRELDATAPEGVRYLVLRADDGTFIHFFSYESEAANEGLTGLPAFAAFVEGGEARRAAPPVRTNVTLVGNYGMLRE